MIRPQHALIAPRLKKTLKWARRVFLRAAAFSLSRSTVHSQGCAVVVSPHPDDEVLACGGMIAAKRAAGAEVHVAFLTRGEGSHRSCCRIESAVLGAARKGLAEEAAAVLGVPRSHLHWLGLKDGGIPSADADGFEDAVASVASVLDEVGPKEVFCPHPLDCWRDHEAAAQITLAAVERLKRPCTVHFYLVWGWYNMPLCRLPRLGLRWAWRLDIRPVMEKKQAAMRAYLDALAPGCGNPYVGVLPKGFLKPFERPYEVFFARDRH